MCGIFGVIVKEKSGVNNSLIEKWLKNIALLSVARGKDSSGIVFKNEKAAKLELLKGDVPVYDLLRSREYAAFLKSALEAYEAGFPFQAIGHARLVTNGSQLLETNNQPVIKDGVIAIHNGIIVNAPELWDSYAQLKREYDIDTEILLALVKNELNADKGLAESVATATKQVRGTVSSALLFNDRHELALVTNNGSLYFITEKEYFIFASERHFLEELKRKCSLPEKVMQLLPDNGMIIDAKTLTVENFGISGPFTSTKKNVRHAGYIIEKLVLKNRNNKEMLIDPATYLKKGQETALLNLLENNSERIRQLQRCAKCLLPKTFPYIEYDDRGVCNYCTNYVQKNQAKSLDELKKLIEPYKRKTNRANCLVPFSGGRDSTYTLHYVKKELGLNPIAFTYDWGMVTDLARRNAARVCGKLGVENIIVAADIHLKRQNIRKNISAWLKKPHLGMIPLFMAGDKYFFYYSNKILGQNDLDVSIWGSNPLENTDFKAGFTGIKPNFNKKRIDELKLMNKVRLAGFFAENYLGNPAYLNSSLVDTIGAFSSRYVIKRKGYFQLFDYMKWDEKVIDDLITNEYDWEKSIDTQSTWRIGDGTAAFYNYIYYTVAGFSEFDTFRSNQIREGQLSREKGLELVYEENRPRFENLRWYLDIVGLDFKSTIERINAIPKLYS